MEYKRKVLPLKDVKSLRALNAFQALIMGMKMIPGNAHLSFEELSTVVEAMEPKDQINFFTQAAKMVELSPEEVKAITCFCTDKNGIPYTAENVKNLKPNELVEVIVTVCMEILQNIHIDIITESEKKKSSPSQLTSAALS